MAEKDPVIDTMNRKSASFTCGVIEGFYGRPWTTEQRKDLFQKLKKWGMDAYVYAPKDDYKHRAYWRELYTVEEAEHLSGLISAARENGITFYYALSPGLDIVYSSAKEVSAIKRKLDQVSQFGCSAFALLFDDIEPEMSEADKEVFQSFAHAQVSVSNEVYQHLNHPKFMVCPTEYCAARADPNVSSSEYLNTLGSKLLTEIDIMWTGPMVVSRLMSIESLEEIAGALRRPPVIWDNLHANDYDQKRVFLGPYAWRSPDLIVKLRGVMTNPNCEYGANFVGIHTLAQWSRCNVDGKRDLSLNDTVSADIKLETETEDGTSGEDIPSNLTPNMYHPRRALNNAINAWLPEFSRQKQAWGPIVKPQPVLPAIAVPILPSINTCMSLPTTTTTTTSTSATAVQPMPTSSQTSVVSPLPSVSVAPSTVVVPPTPAPIPVLTEIAVPLSTESFPVQPVSAPVMNSLASESKVVAIPPLAQPLPLPLTAAPSISIPIPLPLPLPLAAAGTGEPMDCNPTPNGSPAHLGKTAASSTEDVAMTENGVATVAPPLGSSCSSTMQVEVTDSNSSVHSTPSQMVVEPAGSDEDRSEKEALTYQDIALLCDLFYLPFEHGSSGLLLLQEFNWLKSHAHLVAKNAQNSETGHSSEQPEVQEWFDRAGKFEELTRSVNRLFLRLTNCPNRELLHELYPYVWDVRGIVSLLNSYVKWLAIGQFPTTVGRYTLGNYTWFSKGWKETFMSGEHEPWVFRGGLIADLQRLIPVDSGTDLFAYKIPEVPCSKIYDVRPMVVQDRHVIRDICHSVYATAGINFAFFPHLLTDRFVGCILDVSPFMALVIHDEDDTVVGFAGSALDAEEFKAKMKNVFIPTMCATYPLSAVAEESPEVQELVNWFHTYEEAPETVTNLHPSTMCCAVHPSVQDPSALKRLVVGLLAALRANGSYGVHAAIRSSDQISLDLYSKLGFVDLNPNGQGSTKFLGRNF